MDDIRQTILGMEEELIALRRDFHMYPELGFEENRTAEIVETYLQALDIPTECMATTGNGGHSQCVVWHHGH